MKIKLIFDAQFVGREEVTVEVPDTISDEDIKKLFPEYIGIEYDENCSWTTT